MEEKVGLEEIGIYQLNSFQAINWYSHQNKFFHIWGYLGRAFTYRQAWNWGA